MDAALNQLILELYRGSRECPADEFQDRALDAVQKAIPFDSAVWGAGANNPHVIHHVHLYRQPQRMNEDYVAGFQDKDFMRVKVSETPGVTVNLADLVTRDEYRRTDIYRGFSHRYGIEQILCTVLVDPVSGLYQFLSLWRADPRRPFREAERRAKQSLMPHLVESYRTNRIVSMRQLAFGRGKSAHAAAVCNRLGILHEIEGRFASLLRIEWPRWGGAELPRGLRQCAASGTGEGFLGKRIVVSAAPLKDLVVLLAREKTEVDALGRRERMAAERFAGGKTHQQVAQALGVSASTVRNQLRSVYRKLGVTDKAELARVLGDSA
ncbi:MAG: hypothetical protein HY039_08575 [Nitrospirae bacterium]|nr:hypothetical protein [Nitrospirota bacterium]